MRRLATLAALLLAGCTSERDWRMVAASFRVEAGSSNANGDTAYHTKDAGVSTDSTWVAFSIQPLAFLDPPREVIVIPGNKPCESKTK